MKSGSIENRGDLVVVSALRVRVLRCKAGVDQVNEREQS